MNKLTLRHQIMNSFTPASSNFLSSGNLSLNEEIRVTFLAGTIEITAKVSGSPSTTGLKHLGSSASKLSLVALTATLNFVDPFWSTTP